MFKKILSTILPPICPLCRNFSKHPQELCEACTNQIPRMREPCCPICNVAFPVAEGISHPCPDCQRLTPGFDWHQSCTFYMEPFNQLIYRLKYKSQLNLAPILASLIFNRKKHLIEVADCLIAVPLSIKRLRSRGYNQSLEMAKALSSKTQIPVYIDDFKKIRETPSQTGLSRKERLKNLKGAFEWQGGSHLIKGKKLILIDDVYTTGSTLSTCAKELRRYKPHLIGAITLAYREFQG